MFLWQCSLNFKCNILNTSILDINEGRLAKAKELGADHIIKVDSTDGGKDVANKVIEVMGHADRTLECTGIESCLHTGVYVSFVPGASCTKPG